MGSYSFLIFFLWIMPWHPSSTADDFSDIEIYDENEPRSRLLMVDGHMWFHAGRGKNVTFKTSGGGSIFLDRTDISKLPELVSHRVYDRVYIDRFLTINQTKQRGNLADIARVHAFRLGYKK